MAVENHLGEYWALYICCTCSHSSMIALAMLLERDEGVVSARSRANRKEAFDRPTASNASKVVVAKSNKASRGVDGKSQIWCRKLDTRTSSYESSVGRWVCWSGLREATTAQVAGGSDRPAGGACVGRVCCPALAGARGGGGAMTGAAAVGCSGYVWVRKFGCRIGASWKRRSPRWPRSFTSSAPSRDLYSRVSFSRNVRIILV